MRYYVNNSKNPARIKPWRRIEPFIKNSYERDEVLPVGLARITLRSPLPDMNLTRGKYLSDRRIKVRPCLEPEPTLIFEFDFEQFIIEEIGTPITLREIEKTLHKVESHIREEIASAFSLSIAKIVRLTMFRTVRIPVETDRIMRLLELLSRNRGGQDLENPIVDPRIPHWSSGSILSYSRYNGKNSPDAYVRAVAANLRTDQIRFEVRNMCSYGNIQNAMSVSMLINNHVQLLHQYTASCELPFDLSLRQIHGIELETSREEVPALQQANPNHFDRYVYRPFKDAANVDLISHLKGRLFNFPSLRTE